MELYCDRLARALAGVINIIDPARHRAGRRAVAHERSSTSRVPELWKRYVFSEPDHIVTRLLPPRTAIRAACAARRGCGRSSARHLNGGSSKLRSLRECSEASSLRSRSIVSRPIRRCSPTARW